MPLPLQSLRSQCSAAIMSLSLHTTMPCYSSILHFEARCASQWTLAVAGWPPSLALTRDTHSSHMPSSSRTHIHHPAARADHARGHRLSDSTLITSRKGQTAAHSQKSSPESGAALQSRNPTKQRAPWHSARPHPADEARQTALRKLLRVCDLCKHRPLRHAGIRELRVRCAVAARRVCCVDDVFLPVVFAAAC